MNDLPTGVVALGLLGKPRNATSLTRSWRPPATNVSGTVSGATR